MLVNKHVVQRHLIYAGSMTVLHGNGVIWTDLFSLPTRVKNKQGKVITVQPPWGGSGVSFSSQFEEKVIDLLQATKNQTKTALLVNCSFSMVNRIMHNSVERGMKRRPKELAFTNLSIDEKSFKRNHHYVTVLSTPLSGVVIDVCENRTKQACSKLLSEVLKDQADNVQTVSVDMWKAYLESISDVLPNAKIVHDRFHFKLFNISVSNLAYEQLIIRLAKLGR